MDRKALSIQIALDIINSTANPAHPTATQNVNVDNLASIIERGLARPGEERKARELRPVEEYFEEGRDWTSFETDVYRHAFKLFQDKHHDDITLLRKEFSDVILQITAHAISGLADQAIVGEGPFNETHTLTIVKMLAEEHRRLRVENAQLREKGQKFRNIIHNASPDKGFGQRFADACTEWDAVVEPETKTA